MKEREEGTWDKKREEEEAEGEERQEEEAIHRRPESDITNEKSKFPSLP